MVKLLMFRGADRNSKSSGTETVLTRATKNGISDSVRILLEYVSNMSDCVVISYRYTHVSLLLRASF